MLAAGALCSCDTLSHRLFRCWSSSTFCHFIITPRHRANSRPQGSADPCGGDVVAAVNLNHGLKAASLNGVNGAAEKEREKEKEKKKKKETKIEKATAGAEDVAADSPGHVNGEEKESDDSDDDDDDDDEVKPFLSPPRLNRRGSVYRNMETLVRAPTGSDGVIVKGDLDVSARARRAKKRASTSAPGDDNNSDSSGGDGDGDIENGCWSRLVQRALCQSKHGYVLFLPTDAWIIRWEWLTLVVMLFFFVDTPFEMAFNSSSDDSTAYVVVIALCSVVYLLDILVHFRTGYSLPGKHSSRVEMRPAHISSHYMRGFLVIDVVAAIPFDLLLICE
jgi:hypothetical protein